MTFSAKYTDDGSVTAGPLSDGITWGNITPDSRFYDEVMALTNNGADILPYVDPAPPVPDQISDRQFFQQLAIDGLITTDEALGAVMTGTLPAAMGAFISALPAEQQFGARMALCGATTFQRSHPLVDAFATMQGMTPEQIDELWRTAAAL